MITQEYHCSICWTDIIPRTMINGTVVCKKCVEESVAKSKAETLKGQLAEAIRNKNGMEDIYD